MGRKLAWAGVVLGAVYLIYVGGGWWGIYSPYLRIATMLIAAATLGTWAVVARRDHAWRPRSVMWPAIAAVLVSLTISTIFSRYPRVSLEYLGYTIVLVPLYLLLVRVFADDFFRRRLVVLASMLFGVTAALYIATVIGGWIEWWQLAGLTVPPLRPGFGGLTYNNPSAVLTMVALLGVVPAGAFGGTTRRRAAVLLSVMVIVGAVAVMSGSRAGWFALGVTGVVALATWLWHADNRRLASERARQILRSPSMRVATGASLVVVLVVAVALAPAALRRLSEGGEDLRLGYAAAAARMFGESPIVGTGPGTWVIQRPAYTLASEPDYYIPHAHNLEVQTLAELGVVGGIAGLIVVANIAWLLRRSARGGDARRRWWAWATGIGLMYFALHQVFDFYANMPAFLFAASFPIAYLDATTRDRLSVPVAGRLRRWATVSAVAVIVVATGGLIWQEVAATRQQQATAVALAGDWAAADASAREAAELDPDIGSYQLTAGLTAAHAGDHAAAARFFERVVERADLPEAWLNLAAEQQALGDMEHARDSLQSAVRLGRQRNAIAIAAGDLALRLGDREMAIELFVDAIVRTPSILADPWWQSGTDRNELVPELARRASAASPDSAWQIWLMAGDADRAAAAAGGPGFRSLVVDAWFGDETAIEEVLGACRNQPLEVGLLGWCARLTRHLGDDAAAAGFSRRIEMISIGASGLGAELRVSPAGVSPRQLAGDPADLWATYTYRRPAAWDLLVPSLIHLRLE